MPRTIVCTTDPALFPYQSRVQYVLDTLNAHPLMQATTCRWAWAPAGAKLPENALHYHYGLTPPSYPFDGFIQADIPLLAAGPGKSVTPSLQFFLKENLYGISSYLIEKQNINSFFQKENRTYSTDWIAGMFFTLSRAEEYFTGEKDDIGLVPGAVLFAVKNNIHTRPILDEWAAWLAGHIQGKPIQIATAISTSHDLDTLDFMGKDFRLLRYLGGSALRYRTIRQWPGIISDYIGVKTGRRKDPADTFDWLLKMHPGTEKYLFLGTGIAAPQDTFPDLRRPAMARIRDMAREEGYSIGFHPGYATWKDARQWQSERQQLEDWLGAPVTHSRQHFLRMAFPDTLDILEQSGIKTDHSLGFRRHIGFRCGTGFAYFLYNFKQEKAFQWQEQPLALMDIALLREAGFDKKNLLKIWSDFFHQNQYNTHIALDFHNPGCYEPQRAGLPLLTLYQQLFHAHAAVFPHPL